MSDVALFDLAFIGPDLHAGPFQMQSHSPVRIGEPEREWKPMERGPAASVWRPRKTAREAVHKCMEWTGLISIPAMQVVDLASGAVVWRGVSEYDPEAGAAITPSWAEELREQVNEELREHMRRELAIAGIEASE